MWTRGFRGGVSVGLGIKLRTDFEGVLGAEDVMEACI
jgi:hypothetical protein